MKVVIIGPNVGLGGVERASSNIANGIHELGHDITYLALIQEQPFYSLKANYIEPIGFNKDSMSFWRTVFYIRREIKNINPDAILCYTKFYSALANIALIFTRHKIYVTERSSPFYKWPKKIELICKLSFFIKKPSGIISQTQIASEYHQQYYGKTKYITIPNAVREVCMYPDIERQNVLLAVGRFNDPCKGFDLLIKAFNLVKNESWRLVFAGGTPEEGQYLMDLAADSKKSRIEFLGPVKDMDLLYAKAGIFIMPSRTEGFPNALLEAMCSGCCCVSFDFIAGPRDLIEDGVNGVIVEANNVQSLAIAIDALIENENQRVTYQKEAMKISLNFNEMTVAKRFLKFLEN